MSLAFLPRLRKRPLLATLFATLVPLALPCAAGAQEAGDASATRMANHVVAEAWPMLAPLPPSLVATAAVLELNAAPAVGGFDLEAGAGSDDAVPMNAPPLDDQMLSRQRGGRAGMVMVTATPQLMRGGNAVTLWDEIAPPAPLPVPVDSGRVAQGNVVSYTRK